MRSDVFAASPAGEPIDIEESAVRTFERVRGQSIGQFVG